MLVGWVNLVGVANRFARMKSLIFWGFYFSVFLIYSGASWENSTGTNGHNRVKTKFEKTLGILMRLPTLAIFFRFSELRPWMYLFKIVFWNEYFVRMTETITDFKINYYKLPTTCQNGTKLSDKTISLCRQESAGKNRTRRVFFLRSVFFFDPKFHRFSKVFNS